MTLVTTIKSAPIDLIGEIRKQSEFFISSDITLNTYWLTRHTLANSLENVRSYQVGAEHGKP
jgi:hypothetical protein